MASAPQTTPSAPLIVAAGLAKRYPRIERRVRHVGKKVARQNHRRGKQQRHQGEVEVVAHDRREDQLTHTRPGEDVFSQDSAPEEDPELKTHHGDHRDETVAQGVFEHNLSFAQSLGHELL